MRTHDPAEQVLPLMGGNREEGGGEVRSVNRETRVNGGHVTHTRMTFPAFEPTVLDTASSPATHHTAPSHTTHNTEISYATNGSRSTRETGVHAHAHAAWFQKHFGNYAATTALLQTVTSRGGGVVGGTHFTCFTGTRVQILTQHK